MTSMLTQHDLDLIAAMISDAITKAMAVQPDEKPVTQKSYHDSEEIKKIIIEHLDEFRAFVGFDYFAVETLRCFLRTKMTLSEADVEIVDNRYPGGKTRFCAMVCYVLARPWPDGPFIKLNRNRYAFR